MQVIEECCACVRSIEENWTTNVVAALRGTRDAGAGLARMSAIDACRGRTRHLRETGGTSTRMRFREKLRD
jgi:hypothetical protein